MERVVVIGGGGHAKVVISILQKLDYDVIGYTDPVAQGAILGIRPLGADDVLIDVIERGAREAAIGLGKIDASSARQQLAKTIVDFGFSLPVIVSPQAVVNQGVEFGAGTVVCDGAVVNSGTTTGALCILNTNCSVDHDCTLDDNVHVGPGATISGGVMIGANTMIGAGSTVVQGVVVCEGCLIGAGAVVTHDIRIPGMHVGNPARRIA